MSATPFMLTAASVLTASLALAQPQRPSPRGAATGAWMEPLRAELTRCLRREPPQRTRVDIELEAGTDGRVHLLDIAPSSAVSPALRACVRLAARSTRVPEGARTQQPLQLSWRFHILPQD